MVKELASREEFQTEIRAPGKLVVVDFYATWCGPCKMIAPVVEELSRRYTDVNFIKVAEHNFQELIMERGVRAFPTFQFFIDGELVDELKGADQSALVGKIEQHRARIPRAFGGSGMTLGASSSSEDPREARLRKLNQRPMSDSEAQAMIQKALEDSVAQRSAAPAPAAEPVAAHTTDAAPTGAPVNMEVLGSLIEMGFGEIRSRKATKYTSNLEDAVNWLEEHQDDPDIDEPGAPNVDADGTAVAMEQVEYTGPSLTTDEIREKLARRRMERQEEEKQAELLREKARRETGKQVTKTSEELAAMQRKRDIDKIKREKDEAKRERDRIRAEIAKDKAERKTHGGKLASKLGVDGYNPSAINYDDGAKVPVEAQAKEHQDPAAETKTDRTPQEQVNISIQRLARYRVGGDGGIALRTLRTMIGNIVNHPEEDKYRSVNLENKTFKQKVAALVGGVSLLVAVGFAKQETRLLMEQSDIDMPLLQETLVKLDAAIQAYSAANPMC